MNKLYEIVVVRGWQTRTRPEPGAPPRVIYPVGTTLSASLILSLDGVAYARLINPDGRDEWGRLGEKGYCMLSDTTGEPILHPEVKHYAEPHLIATVGWGVKKKLQVSIDDVVVYQSYL